MTSLKRGSVGLFAVFLLGGGGILAWYSYEMLGSLFSEHQDSPPSTYLVLGLPPLILGLAGIIGAIVLLARLGDQAGGGE